MVTSHFVYVARVGCHRQSSHQLKDRHIFLSRTKLIEEKEVCDAAQRHNSAEHVGVQEWVVGAPLEGFIDLPDLRQRP